MGLTGDWQSSPNAFEPNPFSCSCADVVDLIQLAHGDMRDWSKAADRSDVNCAFGEDTYKCNLFADETYETGGYHLPNTGGHGVLTDHEGRYQSGVQNLSTSGHNLPN